MGIDDKTRFKLRELEMVKRPAGGWDDAPTMEAKYELHSSGWMAVPVIEAEPT